MKVKLLTFSMTIMMIVASCGNDSGDAPESPVDEMKNLTGTLDNRLPIGLKDLTALDAKTLAGIFAGKDKTRATGGKSVKNVVTINDHKGEPAIYAVNFNEGGYLLVSATTNYVPVLAIVEKGEYKVDKEATGEDVVISDMIVNITLAKENKMDKDYRSLWLQYMDSDKPARKTRVSNEYYDEFDRWYGQHSSDGSQIYKLTHLEDVLPYDVYNHFVEAASTYDFWEDTEYSWENTAYVVVKTTSNVESKGPYLSTKWKQIPGENPPIKCEPVAVAQLMRFHEYPLVYSWNNMTNTGNYNETTIEFLRIVRDRIGVFNDGSAFFGDAKGALEKFGYIVSKYEHDASKIAQEIRAGRPVLAHGHKGTLQTAHVWVEDGIYSSYTNVSYTLYRLNCDYYPEFEYQEAEVSPWESYSDVFLFHMNWGWGGNHDGWYNDTNIQFTSDTGEVINYKYGREEMSVRKP